MLRYIFSHTLLHVEMTCLHAKRNLLRRIVYLIIYRICKSSPILLLKSHSLYAFEISVLWLTFFPNKGWVLLTFLREKFRSMHLQSWQYIEHKKIIKVKSKFVEHLAITKNKESSRRQVTVIA